MDNFYYDVHCVDRMNGNSVCVGALLTRGEAARVKRQLEEFNACDIQIFKYHYEKGRAVDDV